MLAAMIPWPFSTTSGPPKTHQVTGYRYLLVVIFGVSVIFDGEDLAIFFGIQGSISAWKHALYDRHGSQEKFGARGVWIAVDGNGASQRTMSNLNLLRRAVMKGSLREWHRNLWNFNKRHQRFRGYLQCTVTHGHILIYIMFWCNFDQHLSYLQESLFQTGKAWGAKRLFIVEVSAFYASLTVLSLRCPALLLRTVGVTWEHIERKVEIFSQPQKETYSFQQQKVRSLLSLVYFKDHLHIETLVFFFLLHQFWDDCETQWLPAPNFPPTKTRVQDECSGVGA